MEKKKRGAMDLDAERPKELPLAQVEDMEELKRRYRFVDSTVLRRWMTVVVGPHREAMAEILRQRGVEP